MKKKRGRPKGKSYPEPHTTAEGFDIAICGKLGGSEAMALLRDCPYLMIDFLQKRDPKYCDIVDEKFLKRLRKSVPKLAEKWLRQIGPILSKKIAAGDSEFFRELGDAVDEFVRESRQIESVRRYLAMEYKLFCSAINAP